MPMNKQIALHTAAALAWLAAMIWQIVNQPKAWPLDALQALPGYLGDVVIMFFWLGCAPVIFAYIFLAPLISSRRAKLAAMLYAVLTGLLMVAVNYYHAFVSMRRGLGLFAGLMNFSAIVIFSLFLLGVSLLIKSLIMYVHKQALHS
jgi:hypothetical protein